LVDPDNSWHDTYEITTTGTVLVRPDGHVVWRSKSMGDNPKVILNKILSAMLQPI
jgi:putative polyketide hydroxylase